MSNDKLSSFRTTRRGFTLVEVLVAIMVLSVGVLAMVASSSNVSRLLGGGNHRAMAARIGQTRFEQLRSGSRRCSAITAGSATTRGMTESWTVASVTGARDVSVSVTYVTPNGSRTAAFRSLIPCT